MARSATHAALPLTRDAVLIGGGHAHALVLRRWGMDPLAGVRLTLIDPHPTAPYTGMLPGLVAGHYRRDALEIDLVRLARFAGARLILGRATALDRSARTVAVATAQGPRTVAYDVLSLDIGIHTDMPDLPGFAEHGVPAKPLDRLADRWAAHLHGPNADAPLAVIGGGVGGVELAMAMAHGGAAAAGRPVPVTVIERDRALPGLGACARAALRARMAALGVRVVEGASVARIDAAGLVLSDGRRIAARFVTGAAGARSYDWLRHTGLALHAGFVTVDATLRSASDDAVFAVGDCAHLSHAPRPKAGVYAVRAAPVLDANLRAALGAGRFRRYHPQRDYLKLISTGAKSAVADKFGLRLSGRWLWRLKDRIDRRFMDRLADLPPMPPTALPRIRAQGLAEAVGDGQAPCGGCGAKVGRATLSAVLGGNGDDAAILRTGGVVQVATVDQVRAFTADPWMLARIAAQHALGDIWAMGAAPQAALITVTLPRLSPRLEARMLAEVMDAAADVLGPAGAPIVGGHTATGAELAITIALTGLCSRAPISLAGARAGDALLLTRAIGSGTILAAEMALRARGPWVAAALDSIAGSQSAAAAILRDAHAMTDVTGFGLVGHLDGMLRASGVSARLSLNSVPLMAGAAALAAAGVRSTLYAQNVAGVPDIALPDDPRVPLLFDPQTAGGLLAAVDADAADALLAALVAAGYNAAKIGALADGPPAITVI